MGLGLSVRGAARVKIEKRSSMDLVAESWLAVDRAVWLDWDEVTEVRRTWEGEGVWVVEVHVCVVVLDCGGVETDCKDVHGCTCSEYTLKLIYNEHVHCTYIHVVCMYMCIHVHVQ